MFKSMVDVSAVALMMAAGTAHAQVVINEVYVNPPGSGSIDDRWEYVEIYGPPGMSLSGYMIASVYGGADQNGNNIPGPLPSGWDAGDEVPEIDESWTLDGQTIGANGLFVLYNNAQASQARLLFAAQTNSATFASTHIPTTDVSGRIKNDGSATFVLVRKRPFHALSAAGTSIYDGVPAASLTSGASYPATNRYAWRKDINPDVNFDGRLDFNGIGTLLLGGGSPAPETGVNSERAATPAVGGPHFMEPYQMVDELSWSNGGGKEYTRSEQQKVSNTDAFNPDAASRVKYYNTNPRRGSRFTGTTMVETHTADEELIYGDVLDTGAQGLPLVSYDAQAAGGPTDPNGPHYNAQGQLDPSGTYLLTDINLTGFKLTPGNFNDVNSTASGGINIVEQRFVRGDFNFDGVVDCADEDLINAAVGDGLDATFTDTNHGGTPTNAADDFTYTAWKHQGRDFNRVLAMVRMSLTDGTTGEWNSGVTVTAQDLAAFHTVFTCPPQCGTADFNGDGDTGTDQDIEAFFRCLAGNCCATCYSGGADFNADGDIGTDGDIESFFRVLAGGNC